ncbi:MAG: RAD55 family ATPase [Thermoplasmataceae archaeon]
MSETETDEIIEKIQELESLRNALAKDVQKALEKQRELDNILVKLKSLSSEKDPSKKAEIVEDIAIINNTERKTIEDRLSSGIKKVDELMLGGIPVSSNLVLFGPPFSGKETLAYNFAAQSITEGVPIVIIAADKDIRNIKKEMARILDEDISIIDRMEERRILRFIDLYSKSIQMASPSKYAIVIDNVSNVSSLMKALDGIAAEMEASFGYYRMLFVSLTAYIPQLDEKLLMRFIQQFVQKRKAENGTAMYLLEDGLFEQKVYETISYMMDGAIEFKIANSKQYIRIVGLGNVKSREWIEVYPRPTTFDLGSFSLERVR